MVLLHYSKCIYLGQTTGSSALSLDPLSTKHLLSHMAWEGWDKTFLWSHCTCIQPSSCYFAVEIHPGSKAAVLTSIPSLKQPLRWSFSGCMSSSKGPCQHALAKNLAFHTHLNNLHSNPPQQQPTKLFILNKWLYCQPRVGEISVQEKEAAQSQGESLSIARKTCCSYRDPH